ncbi:MAG: ATP-binding protein, partial [Elusimicrobiota bacterium]
EGYEVDSAESGIEGIKKIGREKFDLTILDIKMPEMDGIETLGEIKKVAPEMEVIMATGYGSMGTAIESMRKGAFDYVHKPFNIKELLDIIEKALEKRKFNEISRTIFSTIKSEELLEIIIDSVMKILKADDAVLMLEDKSGNLEIKVSDGPLNEAQKLTRLVLGKEILGSLRIEGIMPLVLADDPGNDSKFEHIEGCKEIKFAIFLPLMEDTSIVGLISISRTNFNEYFSEDDLQRAKMFGSLVNLAMRNANLYKQLQDTQILLIQAEKMSALGQLAGGLAHELSNPLSGILGLTQLILANEKPGTQNYNDLQEIEKAVFRCKRIIGSLLSFARQENFNLKSVNVNDILEETFVLYGRQLELKNIKIVKHMTDNIPSVLGDFQQMMQVFLNIFNNAKDAMPEGGTFTVTTNAVTDKDGKEMVEITFTDTGTGIVPDIIDKIFDPFFTTKPVNKGTGLGLSVCLGIINKHDGKIDVRSEPGQGSTFSILLPAQKRQI